MLDASVAACWLLDDEIDPRAAAAAERAPLDGVIVPQLWHLEVRNALLVARRRGRITADGLSQRIGALRNLSVTTDTDTDFDAALALAQVHSLSFYDATYLELALRRQAAVATLDRVLGQAVVVAGLSLVE